MKSVHAVVELDAETGKMVADPLYGLWFPRSDKGYYGIRELRQSPNILSDRIQSLVEQGKRPGTSNLRNYPVEEYSYAYAKTINWEKWVGMWALYKVLRVIMGPSIDDLQRPAFVEAPQIMVVMIAGAIQCGLIIAYFALVRLDGNMKRERSPSHRKPSDVAL